MSTATFIKMPRRLRCIQEGPLGASRSLCELFFIVPHGFAFLSSGMLTAMLFLIPVSVPAASDPTPRCHSGTVRVQALELPESELLSEAARAELRRSREGGDLAAANACTGPMGSGNRKCKSDAFFRTQLYRDLRESYDVTITADVLGGVRAGVFVPKEGIAEKNKHRVLINLRGGGFYEGTDYNAHVESIPVASVGRIKVISVDYRQAPEYTFPAASEDVVAVYRELLKTYAPQNIGIYGCSAGGLLTAEVVAWLQKEGLPRPGAVGLFCEGAAYWFEGDMGRLALARLGPAALYGTMKENPYFKNTDANDPLAFPIRSKEVLAKFPPTILVSATRDQALSSVVATHALLVREGVEAELHVWEGMGHAFFYNFKLPASREAFDIAVKFFDEHLAQELAAVPSNQRRAR